MADKKGRNRRVDVKGQTKRRGKKTRGSCFVISPFGGWHDRYFAEVFKPAVEKAGLEARRADDLYRPSAIVHDIWSYVTTSTVMLADLTGKNPNVFYELGLAHASRKPVVLLTQAIEDVPFDLRALRVITYDVADPDWSVVLHQKIVQALSQVLASPESAVLPTFLQTGGPSPKGRPSEDRRLLDLQLQVNQLASELQSRFRRDARDLIPDPASARALVESYLRQGLPTPLIVERLAARGVPQAWVRAQIERSKRRGARRS